ncbi:YrzI family small protein [Pseudoneobacillus sp. C159]
MILNILFFTIKINKRQWTVSEVQQYEMLKQFEEENRNRQATVIRMY